MKVKRMLLASVLSISLITPVVEITTVNSTTVQAMSVKAAHKKAKARAKKESKEQKEMDDYPLLKRYKLDFDGKKVTGIQVWCDPSLANADESTLRHYFRYGITVGMKAKNSTSKAPYVQIYAGDSGVVAKSKLTNNMTFQDAKKIKYVGSKNRVYGHLTNKTKKSGTLYKDKDLTYVKYAVGKHKAINVVKEDFRNMPLDPSLDQEAISEHVSDFMEKDAVKVNTENGNEIYHSNKINKDYRVEEQKNSKGEITLLIISRQDVNE